MDSRRMGALITRRRKAEGMTQQDLADRLGVTNKAVSKWETGEGYPDIASVPALAEALGVTADELLAGEENAGRDTDGAPDGESVRAAGREQAAYLYQRNAERCRTAGGIAAALAVLSAAAYAVLWRSYQNGWEAIAGLTLNLAAWVLWETVRMRWTAAEKRAAAFGAAQPPAGKSMGRLRAGVVLPTAALGAALVWRAIDWAAGWLPFPLSRYVGAVTAFPPAFFLFLAGCLACAGVLLVQRDRRERARGAQSQRDQADGNAAEGTAGEGEEPAGRG